MAYSSELRPQRLITAYKTDDKTALFEKNTHVDFMLNIENKTLYVVSDRAPNALIRNKGDIQNVIDTSLCNALQELGLAHDVITLDVENSHENAHPQMIEALENGLDYAMCYHNMTSDIDTFGYHQNACPPRRSRRWSIQKLDPEWADSFTSDSIMKLDPR